MPITRLTLLTAATLGVVALLIGCAPTMDELATKCVEYGFQPGSLEFAQCQQNEMASWQRSQDLTGAAMVGFF